VFPTGLHFNVETPNTLGASLVDARLGGTFSSTAAVPTFLDALRAIGQRRISRRVFISDAHDNKFPHVGYSCRNDDKQPAAKLALRRWSWCCPRRIDRYQ
jgi:hypothetical protein